MTEGEYRVGVSFNPSNNILVDTIKQKTAEIIDLLDKFIDNTENIEGIREAYTAMNEFEAAAMWAVKAVTKPPRD